MRTNNIFASSIAKPPVHRIFLAQLLVLVPVVLLLARYNHTDALSWLLGGFVQIIPSAYFSYYAFRFRGARATQLLLKSMYRGEWGKLILTLVGFALVFGGDLNINPLMVFGSYCVTTLLYCLLSQWVVK